VQSEKKENIHKAAKILNSNRMKEKAALETRLFYQLPKDYKFAVG